MTLVLSDSSVFFGEFVFFNDAATLYISIRLWGFVHWELTGRLALSRTPFPSTELTGRLALSRTPSAAKHEDYKPEPIVHSGLMLFGL